MGKPKPKAKPTRETAPPRPKRSGAVETQRGRTVPDPEQPQAVQTTRAR